MSSKQLQLPRPTRQSSWGLPVGVAVAAGALLFVLFFLRGDGRAGLSDPVAGPTLTAARLDAYLVAAPEVRLGRREAREAGWKAATWADYPRIATALEQAGWSMADYMLVEGQIKAARIEIAEPGTVHDLDDPHSRPVPAEHLELVRGRLAEVTRAQAPL